MRLCIIGAFILFCINGLSQVKGTLLIAGVGKDGVILVADSRGSMRNKEGKVIAYMDNIPKIFKLQNIYTAITGDWAIGNTFLSTIISNFNKTKIQKNDFSSIISHFIKYLDSLYPVSKYPYSNKASFVFIGSDSSNYLIQGYMRDLGYTRVVRKKVVISDNNAVPYLGIYYERSSLYKCDSLEVVFKKTIDSYAKGSNLINEIGGENSVVCLGLNNKLKYFKNSFSKNIYKSFADLIKDLKSGRRKFIPTVKGGDKQAIQLIIENYR